MSGASSTIESAMRERYGSCATYEDDGTCALFEVENDGTRVPRFVLRFKTLFDRGAGAFRFDLDGRDGPLVTLWRTSAGAVRVWSQWRRKIEEHPLERAVMGQASLSHRTAGVVAAMLLPREISRIDASLGWTYEQEEEDLLAQEQPMWKLSVGGAETSRTAWVDSSFVLRKLSIRDQSVVTDYETMPRKRSSRTVEAMILYAPSFDQPIDVGGFLFAPPRSR